MTYCDWCEKQYDEQETVEAGDDYICAECAQDMRPVEVECAEDC